MFRKLSFWFYMLMCYDFSKLILLPFALFLFPNSAQGRQKSETLREWCDAKDLEGQTFEVTLIPSDDSEVKISLSVYICVSLMSHIYLFYMSRCIGLFPMLIYLSKSHQ